MSTKIISTTKKLEKSSHLLILEAFASKVVHEIPKKRLY